MADLTDRDVRQIVETALTDVRTSLNNLTNAVRDVRSDLNNLSQPLMPLVNVHTHLATIRGTVDNIKNDSSRIPDVANALHIANTNFMQLQQVLMRVEANMQNSGVITAHLQQVRQDVANLQRILSNLEQFMGDMSQYLQALHDHITTNERTRPPRDLPA